MEHHRSPKRDRTLSAFPRGSGAGFGWVVVISSRRGFIPAGPRGQVARYSFPPCDLAPRAGCPRARRGEITAPALPRSPKRCRVRAERRLISDLVGTRGLNRSLLPVLPGYRSGRRGETGFTNLPHRRLTCTRPARYLATMDAPRPSTGYVVRAGKTYQGKQGPDYTPGISAESVGASGLWLGSVTLPPGGGRTKAHVHESHESAFYLVSGDEVELWTGEELEHREIARVGDYLYVPAGMPHVAVNRSETPAVFVGARTDPNEQESVVMRPELEERVP